MNEMIGFLLLEDASRRSRAELEYRHPARERRRPRRPRRRWAQAVLLRALSR